VGGRKDDEHTA